MSTWTVIERDWPPLRPSLPVQFANDVSDDDDDEDELLSEDEQDECHDALPALPSQEILDDTDVCASPLLNPIQISFLHLQVLYIFIQYPHCNILPWQEHFSPGMGTISPSYSAILTQGAHMHILRDYLEATPMIASFVPGSRKQRSRRLLPGGSNISPTHRVNSRNVRIPRRLKSFWLMSYPSEAQVEERYVCARCYSTTTSHQGCQSFQNANA